MYNTLYKYLPLNTNILHGQLKWGLYLGGGGDQLLTLHLTHICIHCKTGFKFLTFPKNRETLNLNLDRDLAQCSPMIGDKESGEIFQTISAEGTITNCSWMITTKPGYYIQYTVRTALVGRISWIRSCFNLIRLYRFGKSSESTDGELELVCTIR